MGSSRQAETHPDAAVNEVARNQAGLADLERDLAQELAEIDATWAAEAAAAETVEVPLDRSDIRATTLTLAWHPTP